MAVMGCRDCRSAAQQVADEAVEIAAGKMKADDACATGGLHVRRLVPDHQGQVRIKTVIDHGPQDHAWIGLPVRMIGMNKGLDLALGMKGAGIDGIDACAVLGQGVQEQTIERLHLIQAEHTACHAGLIGHDHAEEPGRIQPTHGPSGTGHQP